MIPRIAKMRFNIDYVQEDVYMTPKDGKINRSVIFLHGFGEGAIFWIGYFSSPHVLPEGTRIILLTAPVVKNSLFNKEGHGWFNLENTVQRGKDANVNVEQVMQQRNRILGVVEKEVESLGDPKKVYLAGFSQGGSMVLSCSFYSEQELGGLILYSSYVFKSNYKDHTFSETIPVFWSHGAEDYLSPYKDALDYNGPLFNGKRFIQHTKVIGLGHGVSKQIQCETKRFIETVEYIRDMKPKL